MKKNRCDKCGNYFSIRAGSYNRHYAVCTGVYTRFIKSNQCKHCNTQFSECMGSSERANHSRWCDKNPKRNSYITNGLNEARRHITKESIERASIGIKAAWNSGKYDGAIQKGIETKKKRGTLNHTESTKRAISQKALASNHRRVLKSTRFYHKKDGTYVLLDSSWEEALAIRLDDLNIKWIRPNPIRWVDSHGNSHNYFPDFYLPDHDVYLDPKNKYVYNTSLEKINKVLEIIPNLKILTSLEECKAFRP